LTAPPPRERDAGLERLTFLVDGVYAIAMTLLAVELRLPEAAAHAEGRALLDALLAAWPRVLGFATSFTVIALFWSGHHRIVRVFRRADGVLVWLSLLHLGGIAFLPFPTAVAGEHPGDAVAAGFYFATLLAVGLASSAIWFYASAGRRLLVPGLSEAAVWRFHLVNLAAPLSSLLLLGLVVAGVGQVVNPLLLGWLLALGYIVLALFEWGVQDG